MYIMYMNFFFLFTQQCQNLFQVSYYSNEVKNLNIKVFVQKLSFITEEHQRVKMANSLISVLTTKLRS